MDPVVQAFQAEVRHLYRGKWPSFDVPRCSTICCEATLKSIRLCLRERNGGATFGHYKRAMTGRSADKALFFEGGLDLREVHFSFGVQAPRI